MDDESIDLIYLDPPFNKKKDFIAPIGSKAEGAEFKDWWTMDDVKDEEIGEIGEEYPPVSELIKTAGDISGESHRSYLIVMAIRLIEMKRLLKPAGSIYLHCDPTMSHWLKVLMDAIFGEKNFRNEIIWCYPPKGKGPKLAFHRKHDIIFYYGKSDSGTFNRTYTPLNDAQIAKFSAVDENGRRYKDFKGRRTYLDESLGRPVPSWWTDIAQTGQSRIEMVGYPTQKPLALLQRVIKTSSNKGDIVLDPFCGCATTLVAAESLERKWIGIDQSPMAVKLVRERMSQRDLFVSVIHWDTAEKGYPTRSDNVKRSPNIKQTLYGKQRGFCVICGNHFRFQNFEVDHRNPKSKGGADADDNLQLLCGHCNRVKGGKRTNAETKARLKEIESEYKSGARA
ncbi:MAG: DNA methyltransferase [Thermodesulfobacteriota bacterium]